MTQDVTISKSPSLPPPSPLFLLVKTIFDFTVMISKSQILHHSPPPLFLLPPPPCLPLWALTLSLAASLQPSLTPCPLLQMQVDEEAYTLIKYSGVVKNMAAAPLAATAATPLVLVTFRPFV